MSLAEQLTPIITEIHRQLLLDALVEVEQRTIQAAPEATGLLRSRIRALPTQETGPIFAGELTADTPYAGFTDAGTQPHVIFPRQARVLAWEGDGGVVFARKVNHPGTKGTQWFTGGEPGGDPLRARWQQALQEAVQ